MVTTVFATNIAANDIIPGDLVMFRTAHTASERVALCVQVKQDNGMFSFTELLLAGYSAVPPGTRGLYGYAVRI